MSLVVVLPTEPVTATTGIAALLRTWRARSASAFVVSSTRTSGSSGGAAASRSTSAARAPRACASARKSCPSKRGPRIATKSAPGSSVRESIDTDVRTG
jgi:hypothetical protein